ncbi:FAD-dependent oxidoreductase [Mangrovimonas yunxiaonensis]|uniref:FAD-dependent oxidoreductase n=1 Tax=Mangrovimonas yunxiaonensis TaxID=1197477 RepID=A0A084TKS7_9FLAO|nr:FAD-dependent oxidoreductase [Mangrovimonas yunxiaonensis]KFB01313.1 FAD-dependent oxidoreductase [Mangrovimonas yunxiaonensis]
MEMSYWEKQTWFSNIDFTVIGSGIVGLNCALGLRARFPKAKIVVVERGILPQGASTKNAGFACFGSMSEILDDLNHHTTAEVCKLVEKRYKGLKLLRERLSDKAIGYKAYGGYELFSENEALYQTCMAKVPEINSLLKPVFKTPVFRLKANTNGFQNIQEKIIYNAFEGQIDTGKMMQALLKKAHSEEILILNNIEVLAFQEQPDCVHVQTSIIDFKTAKLFVATNGFAAKLIAEDVKPARAQVLITKPIKNLRIKGTFHLDKGYYYFRNINNRILLGGGRNLDFKTEETFDFGQTDVVKTTLKQLLKTVILPDTPVEVAYFWSGIMGVGATKKALVKPLSDRVFCGVRLGGMGVAIGSQIGEELASLA